MAFEKTSEPGNISLVPTCKPEMDNTIEVSNVVMPVTLTDRIVYSFGTLAVCNACNSGSTEVTLTESTCAKEREAAAHKTETKRKDKYLCMMNNSVSKAINKWEFGRQINGKFQTDLLKGMSNSSQVR